MNLFFVIDDNYIQQCIVTLNSFFKNNAGEHSVYIYSPEISDANREILRVFVEKYRAKLHLCCQKNIDINLSRVTSGQWSTIVFYKLYGMLDIKDVERVLYLDSDIIVDDDISDFYNTDFKDNCAVVIEDTGLPQVMNDTLYYMNRLGIPDEKEYFNAGVMLLNLDLIRRDYTMETLMSEYDKNDAFFSFNEQDLLNKVWNGRLKYTSHRYNRVATDYAYRTYIDKDGDTAIYHYTMNKPWDDGERYLPEEKRYPWCVDIYLKYCDIPEVSDLKDRIEDMIGELGLFEEGLQKQKAGYNPYSYTEHGDIEKQRILHFEAMGIQNITDRVIMQKQLVERKDHVIDFLTILNIKGELRAERYFLDNDIKTIAIYGTGKVCLATEGELQKSSEVLFYVDQNDRHSVRKIDGRVYPIVHPENVDFEKIDAIVITPIGYGEEIRSTLSNICPTVKLVMIEEILFYGERHNK